MEKGGEKSELERLRLRAEEVVNHSLESTRRMEQMCQETRETATGVLVTLDGQGGELEANLKDLVPQHITKRYRATRQHRGRDRQNGCRYQEGGATFEGNDRQSNKKALSPPPVSFKLKKKFRKYQL